MKRVIKQCQRCNEDTIHMVGKKQATNRSSAYTRRDTSKCCTCGTKEINNKHTGRRIIKGKNENN